MEQNEETTLEKTWKLLVLIVVSRLVFTRKTANIVM